MVRQHSERNLCTNINPQMHGTKSFPIIAIEECPVAYLEGALLA